MKLLQVNILIIKNIKYRNKYFYNLYYKISKTKQFLCSNLQMYQILINLIFINASETIICE
jgi:hypothetical protein